MNLPKYSLDNSKVVYFFLAVMIIGGVIAFGKLPKKEDSPFVIKQVAITTSYPGATPAQVEQLITEPIEREIQSMRRVKKVTSESFYGLSKIMIELDPATPSPTIPQMWDELRRKVLNIQPSMPQGASTINVADDFGDVFGIYYGLSAADGFTDQELRNWAQRIKKELVTLEGVQKVSLYGEQSPVVNVFVSLSQLSSLSIRPSDIINALQVQNAIISSGEKSADKVQIKIVETGTYKSVEDIAQQVLTTNQGKQLRLGDIAKIETGYVDPPSSLMLINGQRGIGIGISTSPERDVVKSGEIITAKLAQLQQLIPVGMELRELYPENKIAQQANNTFIINLLESVAIVIVVIMLVMGLRAGLLIGSSLLFSIGGTLLLMLFIGQGLNRTSLAGFIIAMGMLVDNAIVVTDNAQKSIMMGMSRPDALINGATTPQWGLLGATIIAIASFLPLYLAPSSVAEIVKPLFVVLAVSLLLSWVLALTQTPLFGSFILRKSSGETKDPYDNRFYRSFDKLLGGLLRLRWLTVGVVVALFAAAMYTMGVMPQNFFPNLDKPYFRADCFLPDGYNIKDVRKNMEGMQSWLSEQPSVKNVSITMGSSPPRYYLASSSFGPKPNFANILVELHSKDSTAQLEERFNRYATANYPDVLVRSSLFKLSPAVEGTIEIGFIGNNTDTLLSLTQRVQRIMRENPMATNIRNSWGNRVPVWEPQYSQYKGQRLGITRSNMAQQLTVATSGYRLGEYRQADQFMPILMKDISIDNFDLSNLQTIPLYTSNGNVVPLEQVVDGFSLSYNYNVIKRFNRERVMMAQCDVVRGANAKELYGQIYQAAQKVVVPAGYSMKVFGEQESQEESNSALAANMPLTFMIIFITLLLLFRAYKRPLVILLMVPLIFIGVVAGLLVSGKMFDFFAMLGLLGLVGMNIKNAIVLVDEIEIEGKSGKSPYQALVSATRSRVVPVVMASGTTILGMIPLLGDSMFGGMAATIMGGLFVATFLTILVLPVTYSLMFKITKQ